MPGRIVRTPEPPARWWPRPWIDRRYGTVKCGRCGATATGDPVELGDFELLHSLCRDVGRLTDGPAFGR